MGLLKIHEYSCKGFNISLGTSKYSINASQCGSGIQLAVHPLAPLSRRNSVVQGLKNEKVYMEGLFLVCLRRWKVAAWGAGVGTGHMLETRAP